MLKVHRLIWFIHYGELPNFTIDHINGNRSDNRIVNLRDVTVQENNKNRKKKSTGVFFNKNRSKWQSYICSNNKTTYLGIFDKKEDAIKARLIAEKDLAKKQRASIIDEPSI